MLDPNPPRGDATDVDYDAGYGSGKYPSFLAPGKGKPNQFGIYDINTSGTITIQAEYEPDWWELICTSGTMLVYMSSIAGGIAPIRVPLNRPLIIPGIGIHLTVVASGGAILGTVLRWGGRQEPR